MILSDRNKWLALALSLAACDSGIQSHEENGQLALGLVTSNLPLGNALDQGRVRIEGATSLSVTMAPGTTRTIEGLTPGTYTVAFEGLIAGEVVMFGETTGVRIVAGQNTPVQVNLVSFVPLITEIPSAVQAGNPLVLRYTSVPGSTGYRIEWDESPSFSDPSEIETAATTADITLDTPGTFHFRVRARNRFGSDGQPSAAAALTVTAGHVVSITGIGSGTGTVEGAGIACVVVSGATTGTCQVEVADGAALTLTATPTGGSTFAGWGGACENAGTNAACTITVTGDESIIAGFSAPPAQATVTITGAGDGSGTVTGGGINCTVAAGAVSGTCQSTHPVGTALVLTATSASGSTFTGWGGSCAPAGSASSCNLTLNADLTVGVTFAEAPAQGSLVVAGAGSGNGTVTGNGISCQITAGVASGACTITVPHGTAVALTATPVAGHVFEGWSGDCSGTGQCTLTLTGQASVGARFGAPAGFTLTVSPGGAGGGASSGTGTVTGGGINCTISNNSSSGVCQIVATAGSNIALTATAASGSTFEGWEGDCGGTGVCNLSMNGNKSVGAVFSPGPQPTQIAVNPPALNLVVYPEVSYEVHVSIDVTAGSGTLSASMVELHFCPVYDPSVIDYFMGSAAPTRIDLTIRPYLMDLCTVQATITIVSDDSGVLPKTVSLTVDGQYVPDDVTATALPATGIGQTSATMNGHTDGTFYDVELEYSVNADMSNSQTFPMASTVSGPRSWQRVASGLTPNTTYYFRYIAVSAGDCCSHLSNIVSFTTSN